VWAANSGPATTAVLATLVLAAGGRPATRSRVVFALATVAMSGVTARVAR
jgi:hypothetical protein